MLALALQFARKQYVPWAYWFAVAMVSVFGTMAADVTHIVLGVPYLVSTVAFALALTVILVAWYRVESTPSIHTITSPRRESFYWATVLVAFWFAYIVTRPLGASFADWMGVSTARGGLDWGTGPVSLALAGIIVVFVAVLNIRWSRTVEAKGRPVPENAGN